MDGIAVGIGMVGIEGMLGSGGKVTLGRLGIVGRLGSGGSEGLGREGCVVGNVGCGSVGIEGIGGNVGLGKFGTEGKGGNCRRLRAASPPKNDKAMKRAKKVHLKVAMLVIAMGKI